MGGAAMHLGVQLLTGGTYRPAAGALWRLFCPQAGKKACLMTVILLEIQREIRPRTGLSGKARTEKEAN
jgi:hypothetical protein